MNKVKLFFSEVFKRHREDDAEAVVIVGAPGTIPDPSSLSSDCPRPWLYSRVLLFFLLTTALLFLANTLTNPGQFSNVMVIGAFAMPFTTLVLLFEFNVFRNISFYTVLKALFIGGALSLIVTATLPSFWFQGITATSDAFAAGIGEEIAKMLVVYWILKRNKSYPYILNGLLIGAAVGAGFAIFETAGYAMGGLLGGRNEWVGRESMLILLLRNALAPGGHVVWAALSGAGLLMAMRREPLSPYVFGRRVFWTVFIIPVALHVLWDIPLFESSWLEIGFLALLSVAAWGAVVWFLRRGLQEVDTVRTSVPSRWTPTVPPNPAGPWRRWAARTIDMLCGGCVVTVVLLKGLKYFGVDSAFSKLDDTIASIIAMPLVLLMEAILFELFGTTFGKWAFSLRVRDSAGRPATSKAYLKRLFRLWCSGLGFGIPLVSIVVPWIQYKKVSSGAQATYDKALDLRVDKEPFRPLRWLAVLPVLLVLLALILIGMMAEEEKDDSESPESSEPQTSLEISSLIEQSNLKHETDDDGWFFIPFTTEGSDLGIYAARSQKTIVLPTPIQIDGKNMVFLFSPVASVDDVDDSFFRRVLKANSDIRRFSWCELANCIGLRALLPLDATPDDLRSEATDLALAADAAERATTGNDDY